MVGSHSSRAALTIAILALGGCPNTSELPAPSVKATDRPPEGTTKGHAGLGVSDAAGQLERLTTGGGDELFPETNRDGSIILFQEEKYEGSGADKKLVSQLLYGIRPSKPGERELYSTEGRASSYPSFAPDGRSYVFITNTLGPLALVRSRAPAPNAALSAIVSSDLAPEAGEPAFSPDGTRIAFSLRDKVGGGRAVAVIGVDGAKQTVIGEGRAPAWSPDGRAIFFVKTIQGYNHVFRVETSSFVGITQVTQGNMDCDNPTVSPNGRFLAFASNHGHEGLRRGRSELLQLFAARIDGTGLTQLTQGTAKSATPYWGPDGWLYFSSNRDGSFDIYRLRPSGDMAAP